jgi:hypothetical protein
MQGLDWEETYDLVRGRITWFKCVSCDSNGQQYWDRVTGEGVSNSPSTILPENLERGPCDECHGIGFKFKRS